MKRTIVPFIISVFILTTAVAQAPKNQEVPAAMVQFLDDIQSLQPYMISKKEFSSSKNKVDIELRLNHLAEIAGQLKHEERLAAPFFEVMTDVMPQHLREVRDHFKNGHKEYARSMLSSTLDGCSSCHAQVKSKSFHLWKFSPETIKGTDFEKAEFLFAVRQYDEALKYYRSTIDHYKSTDSVSPFFLDVQEALTRKLSIFVRSKRDLAGAIKEVERDLKHPGFPELIKDLLRNDLVSLKELQTVKFPDPATSKSKDVENFAASTLSRHTHGGWIEYRNVIPHMFVSSILYDFAQQHNVSDVGPGVFYWLAKCEKRISKNYYFPLTEIYLKECINRYPASYEAKLCFNDLEDTIIDGYTGSSGTNVPPEEAEKLNEYRKSIGKKEKKYQTTEETP